MKTKKGLPPRTIAAKEGDKPKNKSGPRKAPSHEGKSKSPLVNADAIGKVFDDFESQAKKLGLENPSSRKQKKSLRGGDVTDLVKELLDIASSMKQNKVSLQDMLEGATVATAMKKKNVGTEDIQRFLDSVYDRASKKGKTVAQLIAESEKISSLEKKYAKSFDGLKNDFNLVGKQVASKTKEAAKLDKKILALEKKAQELESSYANQREEISAYKKLSSMGIDGERILNWDSIAQKFDFDPHEFEKEILEQGNLKGLEEKANERIRELEEREEALKQSTARLEQELKNVETEITSIKESALTQISDMNAKVLASIEELNEKAKSSMALLAMQNEKALGDLSQSTQKELKGAAQETKKDLKLNITELKSSVAGLSRELKTLLAEAAPDIKTISKTLEAGEMIGKYKTILPLLEMMEKGEGDEVESLIAIWNVSNRFNLWLNEHYGTKKQAISDPLAKLLSAVNEEIQQVGK